MIVPLRPTTQQTVADGAAPAVKSVLTPLCCGRFLPSKSRRRIIPFLPTCHPAFWSGGEIIASTSGDVAAFGIAAPAIAPVALPIPAPATAPPPTGGGPLASLGP